MFLLLLCAAFKFFYYKPSLKIIDERREKVAEGVRTAEAAAQRLAEAKEESDTLVGQAAKQAEGLVASARLRAEEAGNEAVKEAQSRADALLREARARAEEAKRQAILDSEKEITRAAMLAAEKIMREKAA